MYDKILVGTDGSHGASKAVDAATALAKLSGGTLHLVSVGRPISAAMLVAPTVCSIAAISRGEGPIWRRTKVVAGWSVAGLWCAFIGFPSFCHAPRKRGIQ